MTKEADFRLGRAKRAMLAAGIALCVFAAACLFLVALDLAMIVAGALGNVFAAMAGAEEAVLEAQMSLAAGGILCKPAAGLAALASGIACLVRSRGKGNARAAFVAGIVCCALCGVALVAYAAFFLRAGGGFYWWNFLSLAAVFVCFALTAYAAHCEKRRKPDGKGEGQGFDE